MMKDTVAIVGSHPLTRKKMDFTRTDCDIWAMNEAVSNGTIPRADATFQMHDPIIWRNPENRNDKNYHRWIRREDIPPVYMQEDYPDVPRAVQYPLDGVLEMTKNFNCHRYITSSPAYAIALAIYFGYKRIELYGVEMETNTEYAYQRAGVAYWIGVAVGKGIEVYTESGIFDAPLYGYDGKITISEEEYRQRIDELKPKLAELDTTYKSRRQEVGAAMERYLDDPNDGALIDKIRQLTESAIMYGQVDGAIQENEYYLKKVIDMREHTGGYMIVRQEYEQKMIAIAGKVTEQTGKITLVQKSMDEALNFVKQTANRKRRRVRMEGFAKQLHELLIECVKFGLYQGAAAENNLYAERLDDYIRAAGGSKSAAVMIEKAEVSNG